MSSVEDQIGAALGAYEPECRWELIDSILHGCPDDVFAAASLLVDSSDPRARTLGADLLGRLGPADMPKRDRILRILRGALAIERLPGPTASIVAALGHLGDPSALTLVYPLVFHPSPEVRLAAAFAIATLSPEPLGPQARGALIALSRDTNSEVRDWATHGLGTLFDDDCDEVRDALAARGEDQCPEARAEALFGLAVRHDPRAVPLLIKALKSPQVADLEVDAAALTQDVRLLPALWALQLAGRGNAPALRRAIDLCSGAEKPALA